MICLNLGYRGKKGHYREKGKHENELSNFFIFRLIEFIITTLLVILLIPILGVMVLIVSKDELFELIKDIMATIKNKFKRRF